MNELFFGGGGGGGDLQEDGTVSCCSLSACSCDLIVKRAKSTGRSGKLKAHCPSGLRYSDMCVFTHSPKGSSSMT